MTTTAPTPRPSAGSGAPARVDRRPLLVWSGWTLFVWTTRIRNIWTDDELETAAQVGRTALALAFTLFAVVSIAGWWRERRGARWSFARRWIAAFAVFTTAVWIVRAVQIALADHGAAFIAVHTVLAVISVGLAAWTWRSTVPAGVRHRM